MAPRPYRRVLVALVAVLAMSALVLAVALDIGRWRSDPAGLPPGELFPAGALRVGIDPANPPFAVATADDLFGLEIDLARALGERLGLPVRFVHLGYDGLYDALRVDQVDVLIATLLIDPAKRDDVLYTLPYFNAGLVLVSDEGSPYTSMNAMPGAALAYEFGSSAEAEARRWLRRVLPFDLRPYEQATHALDAARLGEADAALTDAVTARLYLREHPDWQAQYRYVTDHWYAIATRSDRGGVWNAVNQALASLIEDGTLNAIHARWLSAPDS